MKEKVIFDVVLFISLISVMSFCVSSACTDSDGGLVYTTKGTTQSGNVTVSDYCSNGVLTEYNCTGDVITNITKRCWEVNTNYVCRNGKCLTAVFAESDVFPQGYTLSAPYVGCYPPTGPGCGIASINFSSPIYPPFRISFTTPEFTGVGWFYMKSTSYTNISSDGIAKKHISQQYGNDQHIYLKNTSGDFIVWDGDSHSGSVYMVFTKYDDGTWMETERALAGGGTTTYVSRGDSSSYNWNRMDNLSMLTAESQWNVWSHGQVINSINVYESGFTCSDSDNGYNYTVKGNVTTQSSTYLDYCLDDTSVREYACVDDVYDYVDKNCTDYGSGFFCDNGRCNGFTCSSTDAGVLDIYNKGNISSYYNGVLNSTFTDHCFNWSGTQLLDEGDSCDENGIIYYAEVTCGIYLSNSECYDGECTFCNDSDGSNYTSKGNVTDNFGTYLDTCTDSTHLTEYICSNVSSGTYLKNCLDYGSLYVCSDGKCTLPPVNCTDSDEGEEDIFNKGYVLDGYFPGVVFWDGCEDESFLWEQYCDELGVNQAEIDCGYYSEEEFIYYMCYDGACIPPPENCTDSDDVDFYIKGYVEDPFDTYWDYCSDNVTVTEYMCSGEIVDTVEQSCTDLNPDYICSDGRCASPVECTDSDNGLNYYVKGTVTVIVGSFTDYCLSVGDNDNYVAEYYCEEDGGLGLIANRFCEYDCVDGACISLSPTSPESSDLSSPWYRDEEGLLKFNASMCSGWKSMIMCAGFRYSQKQVVNVTSWIFSGVHILYFLVVLIIVIIVGPLLVEFFKSRG